MDATERRRRAAEEAAGWWVTLQVDEVPEFQRREFVDWLRESPVHIAEILRVAQVHGALERFERWAHVPMSLRESDPDDTNIISLGERASLPEVGASSRTGDPLSGSHEPAMRLQRMWRTTKWVAMAAGILGAVLFTDFLMERTRGQVIATGRAERREVVLTDESLVQVDPNTRLHVRYSKQGRDIFLEHGRAVFHVSKNHRRPFFVHSNGTMVRAVGTAFGVEHVGAATIVTVAEGKVSVSSEPGRKPLTPIQGPGAALPGPPQGLVRHGGALLPEDERKPAALPGVPTDRADSAMVSGPAVGGAQVYLTANQQLTVDRGGATEPVREVDSRRELAWATGRLIFRNDPISAVVAEFNRYNAVQLAVADDKLASRPMTGVFNAMEPEAFLAFLKSVAPVQVVRTSETRITISPAPATPADK